MLTAFLIATLVIFVINLGIALLTVAVVVANDTKTFPLIPVVNVFVCLIMITWNIIALTSL